MDEYPSPLPSSRDSTNGDGIPANAEDYINDLLGTIEDLREEVADLQCQLSICRDNQQALRFLMMPGSK